MPLRALINSNEAFSFNYTNDEWNKLKKDVASGHASIILPCCNSLGHLRTSHKGLKHFVHQKGNVSCDWKPESPEHLQAKMEIIKCCLENGWSAIPEYTEKNWRADVIAIKGDKRLAFEIQWSPQTSDETIQRQERYKLSDVRGCWFFKTIPKGFFEARTPKPAVKDLPMFKLQKNEDIMEVVLAENKFSLTDFVKNLLSKKVKFCEVYKMAEQEIEFSFYDTVCHNCTELQQLYTISQPIKSCCAETHYLESSMWDGQEIERNEAVIKVAKEIVNTETAHNLKLGEIKKRFSGMVQHEYLSFGCCKCDAIFGDWFIADERRELMFETDLLKFKRKVDLGNIKFEGAHWCCSKNEKFCEK